MTLFGFFWLIIILFCFFQKDIKYILSLTIFSMVLQCTNIFVIGEINVGPQLFTCFFFILYFLFNKKYQKKFVFDSTTLMLILFFLVIIVSIFINDLKISYILKSIQILIYMLSFIIMCKLSKELDRKYVYKLIKFITIFVLVFGFIQFLTTTGIINRIKIVDLFIYNDHSSNIFYWRNFYNRMCSTFMEASYYGCFLVGTFYYFLSVYDYKKEKTIILIILFFQLLLTFSSTAYIALAVGAIIYLFLGKDRNLKKILLCITIIGVIVAFVFMYDILDKVIFSKSSSGSFVTRKFWNIKALKYYDNSILFGSGFKSVRGSSIFYSLLGEVGLIGTFLYFAYNISILFSNIKNKYLNDNNVLGIKIAIFTIIISQIIACPDLEFCIYWMFLYFYALLSYNAGSKVVN